MTIRAAMRAWTRAIFVCLLAVGLLLPTIDICVCAADLGMASDMQTAALDDSASHGLEEKGGAPCRACHCLHVAGLARMERIVLGTVVADAGLAWTRPDAVHTAPAFALLRPPRA
jgi:hypothetical protein